MFQLCNIIQLISNNHQAFSRSNCYNSPCLNQLNGGYDINIKKPVATTGLNLKPYSSQSKWVIRLEMSL